MHEGEFGERYYREDFGRPYQPDDFWLAHAAAIADVIVSRIAPKRVLDAGCAMGFLVQALRQRGVDAYGLALSSYPLARVPGDARPHCWQASVTDEIAGRYDLIVCIEVLPHLALAEAEGAVANFCRHTDDVLFSVRPYGPAPLHANTAPPEHRAECSRATSSVATSSSTPPPSRRTPSATAGPSTPGTCSCPSTSGAS